MFPDCSYQGCRVTAAADSSLQMKAQKWSRRKKTSNKVALKTPLVDLNLDVGSGVAVKASQGDVWAGRGRRVRDSGLCMDPDLLAPGREFSDLTGLHVISGTEMKVKVWRRPYM